MWRGYKQRQQNSDRLKQLHARAIAANNRALPENTLAQRSKTAIEILSNGPTTKEVLAVLHSVGKYF